MTDPNLSLFAKSEINMNFDDDYEEIDFTSKLNNSVYYQSVMSTPDSKSKFSCPSAFLPNFENKRIRIKEKLGCNYISLLKEFTDQHRVEFDFQYSYHNNFQCVCLLNGEKAGVGIGVNKKEAKTEAAKSAILHLIQSTKNAQYFRRFIDFEQIPFNIDDENHNLDFDISNFDKEKDELEAIIYLNQYCQKKFGQNLVFEFENTKNGFVARLKCGIHNEIGEGASKKIAKQNAAKSLCEKLKISQKEQKMQPIDKIALKCQKLLGQTPTYSEFEISDSGKFKINIMCSNYCFQGVGFKKKDAKNDAAQKLWDHLNQVNPGDFKSFRLDLDKEEINSDEERKDNTVQSTTTGGMTSSTTRILCDVTNVKNKYQEMFQVYAKTKLAALTISKKDDTTRHELYEKLTDFDKKNLAPKEAEIKELESLLDNTLPTLNSFLSVLGIETYLMVGSYLSDSIRRYKYEIDLLALYELKYNNNEEVLINKIKESFQRSMLGANKGDVFSTFVGQKGNKIKNLEITLTVDIKTHNCKHVINIFPCNKGSIKLKKMIKINNDIIESFKKVRMEAKRDLKIVMRLLKYWRDNHFADELQGDIIELIIYMTTKKFTDISLIQTIKSFFEFISVGGLSASKNSWLWENYPDSYWEYVQTAVNKENIEKMENYCRSIIKQGDLEFLIE